MSWLTDIKDKLRCLSSRVNAAESLYAAIGSVPSLRESVAELKASSVTGTPNGFLVETKGYYTKGDGGNGVYYYDSSSVLADNGGTVLAPTVGSGRWIAVVKGPLNLRQFGARGNGTTNDSAAVQAALTAALAARTTVIAPAGAYLLNTTVDVGSSGIIGVGPLTTDFVLTQVGTTFVAGTNDMLVMKASSGARLASFCIAGVDKALWGLKISGARPSMQDVEISRCKEYALVCDQTQNGTFINVCTRFSLVGLALANGARNNVFTNYTSETNSTYFSGVFANSALIHLLINTANPNGFGLSNTVVTYGNDRNHFFGGIIERSALGIKVVNPAAITSSFANAGSTSFYGTEITATKILDTSATFVGRVNFNNAVLIGGTATQPMGSGTNGFVSFEGWAELFGAAEVAARGFTQATNITKLARVRTNELAVSPTYPSEYSYDTPSPPSFNATTKKFSVTGGSNAWSGLSISMGGAFANGNFNAIPIPTTAQRPLMQATFQISNVVGGSGSIALYALCYGTPFRRFQANYAAGQYTVLIPCLGNESGVIFGRNDVTSFDVSNVVVELI